MRTPEILGDSALKIERLARACPKGWVA